MSKEDTGILVRRILVIEDNPINLELITYLLRAFNYMVISASDGQIGIQLAQQEQVDLIICDVHLPKMSGYEVVKYLKENPILGKTPIIAVTALAMVGDRERVLASGFDGYISKPIIPEIFLKQVESFIHDGNKCCDLNDNTCRGDGSEYYG